MQIAQISVEPSTIDTLLQVQLGTTETNSTDAMFNEQLKDQELKPVIMYLKDGTLPEDIKFAESAQFTICNGIFYYVGPTQREKSRVVVPQQLRRQIMQT